MLSHLEKKIASQGANTCPMPTKQTMESSVPLHVQNHDLLYPLFFYHERNTVYTTVELFKRQRLCVQVHRLRSWGASLEQQQAVLLCIITTLHSTLRNRLGFHIKIKRSALLYKGSDTQVLCSTQTATKPEFSTQKREGKTHTSKKRDSSLCPTQQPVFTDRCRCCNTTSFK